MKNLSCILAIGLITYAGCSQATITCSKPTLSNPVAHDAIYHFESTVKCKIAGETIDIPAVKEAYRSEITDPRSTFKVIAQRDIIENKGMEGYWLDVTQTYDIPEGALQARHNVYLLDDNAAKFVYESESKSIHGEDDAAYNRSIVNKVYLKVLPDHSELVSFKSIDVEEPWFAPDAIFFDRVIPRFKDASIKAAMLHARKICGQDVQALQK